MPRRFPERCAGSRVPLGMRARRRLAGEQRHGERRHRALRHRLGGRPDQRDGIISLMIRAEPDVAHGAVEMIVVAGCEMDVIHVNPRRLAVRGCRVNVLRPGEGGTENQKEPRDHGSGTSHAMDYTYRKPPRQASGFPQKKRSGSAPGGPRHVIIRSGARRRGIPRESAG